MNAPKPIVWAVAASIAIVLLYAITLTNDRFDGAKTPSIADALIESNSKYRFRDGVYRKGYSTIHRIDINTAKQVETALRRASLRTNIPVNYLAAHVSRESTGDPKAEFRNLTQWEAAKDDRGRFASIDYGLVQISGRNLLERFPSSNFSELKAKAEDVDFAVEFLADYLDGDLKWASSQNLKSRAGVDDRIMDKAQNPYWLSALAYNRGRAGALSALINPRACLHADLVIMSWNQIDMTTGVDPAAPHHAPTFPPEPPDDPKRLFLHDLGPRIEALQRLLNARLKPTTPLVTDGNFGPATHAALQRFQRDCGLEPTGVTDSPTWKALTGLYPVDSPGAPLPLVMGDVGDHVARLQRLLNEQIGTARTLNVDGNFGPGTRDALLRYQKSKGIIQTGAADAETWEALGFKADLK